MHQPDDDPNDPFDPSCVVQLEGETDQDYASRKRDATVYRGRLEAIKLTGDANVPRGEPSFIVDDFGKGDAVINVDHPNLRITARVFECRGHIARNGFTNGESPLFHGLAGWSRSLWLGWADCVSPRQMSTSTRSCG